MEQSRVIRLDARPEPIAIETDRAALVVVDMQNAFVSPGGMLDQAGVDVSGAPAVLAAAQRTIDAARGLGLPVVFLAMGYPPDLSTAGGPLSPNPRKELALVLMERKPETRGTLLTWGTWDAEIADAVRPRPGDTVIRKQRYSGFAGTPLDQVLRSRGVRWLVVAGVATNVCVESTVRDAYFHEYWPVLVADATMPAGPPSLQDATLFNVERFFGWVTTSDALARAADAAGATAAARAAAGAMKGAGR